MAQNSLNVPTSGPVTPTAFAGDINNALDSLVSKNSGASAPTNFPTSGGAATEFQEWADTTVAAKPKLNIHDGTQFVRQGSIDTVNHYWQAVIGGGFEAVSTAATVDLGATDCLYLGVNGAGTINSFGSSAIKGSIRFLVFFSSITLTHNNSFIICPNNANLNVVFNDAVIVVKEDTSTLWRVLSYMKFTPTTVAAPTFTRLTSGSGTYTPPVGCTRVRVRMMGGGAASNGGGNGGTTQYGAWTAIGGSQGATSAGGGGGGAGGTGGANGTGTLISRQAGGAGLSGLVFSNSAVGTVISVTPGGVGRFGQGVNSGGGGFNSSTLNYNNSSVTFPGGGGAGEYVEFDVASPVAVSYAVGAGAGAGAAGVILIEEIYG